MVALVEVGDVVEEAEDDMDVEWVDQFMCGGVCWLLPLDELTSSASSIVLLVVVVVMVLLVITEAIGLIEHGAE